MVSHNAKLRLIKDGRYNCEGHRTKATDCVQYPFNFMLLKEFIFFAKTYREEEFGAEFPLKEIT